MSVLSFSAEVGDFREIQNVTIRDAYLCHFFALKCNETPSYVWSYSRHDTWLNVHVGWLNPMQIRFEHPMIFSHLRSPGSESTVSSRLNRNKVEETLGMFDVNKNRTFLDLRGFNVGKTMSFLPIV